MLRYLGLFNRAELTNIGGKKTKKFQPKTKTKKESKKNY